MSLRDLKQGLQTCWVTFSMERRVAPILLGVSLIVIGGCAAVPPSKYYELEAPQVSSPAAGQPLPVTLLVGPLKSSHLYREDRIVYATGSEEMGTYQLRRWAQPPTEMLQELLWRSLRASHRYAGVNLLTSSAHGDYLLQGNLYDFKEMSGGTLAARVSLGLELRDLKTGVVVWTHDYTHDEPVSGKEVSDVVAALDRNAQRGVSEAAASLNEYLTAHSQRGSS